MANDLAATEAATQKALNPGVERFAPGTPRPSETRTMGNTAVTVTGGTAEQRALTFNVTQQMYDKDPAFKQAIDSKAASGESIRLEDTPEGIGGLAVTAGNVMAVDPKKDVGDNQDYANTIAHELSHNMGLDHSPELFAFAEHAGSTVA